MLCYSTLYEYVPGTEYCISAVRTRQPSRGVACMFLHRAKVRSISVNRDGANYSVAVRHPPVAPWQKRGGTASTSIVC